MLFMYSYLTLVNKIKFLETNTLNIKQGLKKKNIFKHDGFKKIETFC